MISQSFYTMKAGDVIKANLNGGQNVTVFSSPYYLDQTHGKLNVDLATTQKENGTAVLPLQQPESGETDSLVLTADAFAALTEQEQSILILHCVLGMSDGKIGEIMELSRYAVQRRRRKALDELRNKLAAMMPKGG